MKRDLLPELDSVRLNTQALYLRLIKRLGRNPRQPSEAQSGRGGDGVLDAADAEALWSALLQQQFTASQEAALLMGLRVHGESAPMLTAFVNASRAHIHWIASPQRPVVVLHCLGAMRKQPSLAALLAIELVAAGLPTLIITASSASPCSSAIVMQQLGMAAASDSAQASRQLAGDRMAWIQLETVTPLLARVIARRAELGFRNSAHTVVKLLSPIAGPSILVAHYTHGGYRERLASAIELLRANALLVRGTEGDPIAWDADSHPPLAWCAGERVELPEGSTRSNQRQSALTHGDPTEGSVAFIREVLRDARPCPAAIAAQVRRLSFIAATAAAK